MEPLFRPTRGNSPEKAERAQQLRRAMTPEERILWQALRSLRARGFAFHRQQVIAGVITYCIVMRHGWWLRWMAAFTTHSEHTTPSVTRYSRAMVYGSSVSRMMRSGSGFLRSSGASSNW